MMMKKKEQQTFFKPHESDSSGAILITLMWIIAILTLMASGIAYRASIQARLTGYRLREFSSESLSSAAVTKTSFALRTLLESNVTSLTDLQSLSGEINIHNTVVLTEVFDEESKINLNTAPKDILENLPGVDEELAESIQDWLDEDDNERQDGAESTYYRRLRSPYPCKNAKMDTLEEFSLIKGVNSTIVNQLKGLVTIYGDGKVNINTASSEVLMIIGFDELTAEIILRYRLGEDGVTGTEDDGIFESIENIIEDLDEFEYLDQIESETIQSILSKDLIDVKSSHFSIRSFVPDIKESKKVIAVVTFDEDNKTKILSWRLDRLNTPDNL